MRALECGIECFDGGNTHTMYEAPKGESYTMECEDCGMKLFAENSGGMSETVGEFL